MMNVQSLHIHQNAVDYLQLNSGKVVDKSDLWIIKPVKTDDASSALAKAIKAMTGSQTGNIQGLDGIQSININNGKIDTIQWDNGSIFNNGNHISHCTL